jgi:choline kinase
MIILAAGQGTRLRPLTDTRPKCLIELGGRSLLDRQIEVAHAAGVDEVVVVGGYMAERLRRPGLRLVLNPDYETTNMVTTLFCAEGFFEDGFIMSYGDIAYGPAIMRTLLADASPVGVVVDRDWRDYWTLRFDDPLSDAESLQVDDAGRIQSIGQTVTDIDSVEAQYIGLVAFRESGVAALRQTYATAQADDDSERFPFNGGRPLANLFMTDLLQGMIDLGHPVSAVPVRRGWVEIDSLHDLTVARQLAAEGGLE